MSAVIQLSLDGRRFEGRWNDSIGHCITPNDFNNELRRINLEYSRRFYRGNGSWDRVAYALPFICIPFGVLLIALAFQAQQWPFLVAGIVVGVAGLMGALCFRAVFGIVLAMLGVSVAIIPYTTDVSWICLTIGVMMAILGCLGLMAFAFRDRDAMRSARIMVALLPIGIAFICVPAGSVDYHWVMGITGVVLILLGIFGAFEAVSSKQRRLERSIASMRRLIGQLNTRYQNTLIWTLIENDADRRSDMDAAWEIVVEEHPACPKQQDTKEVAEETPAAQAAPPVVNVVINQGGADDTPRDQVHPSNAV